MFSFAFVRYDITVFSVFMCILIYVHTAPISFQIRTQALKHLYSRPNEWFECDSHFPLRSANEEAHRRYFHIKFCLLKCGVEMCKSTWWKDSLEPSFPLSLPSWSRQPGPPPASLAGHQVPRAWKEDMILNLFCFVTTFEFARSQNIPLHVIKTRIICLNAAFFLFWKFGTSQVL